MNKPKQEMLALVDVLKSIEFEIANETDEKEADDFIQTLIAIRALITESVILSDGEIEEVRDHWQEYEAVSDSFARGCGATIDKIKDMK